MIRASLISLVALGGTFNSITDNLIGPGEGNIDLGSDDEIGVRFEKIRVTLQRLDQDGVSRTQAGVAKAFVQQFAAMPQCQCGGHLKRIPQAPAVHIHGDGFYKTETQKLWRVKQEAMERG